MNTIFKKIVLVALFLSVVKTGYSQYITLENTTGVQYYSDAHSREGMKSYKVGYQFKQKWCVDLEFSSTQASYEIRMPDKVAMDTDWHFVNVFTILFYAILNNSNDKEVYKNYKRNMYSYNALIGFQPSSQIKLFAGPAFRHNKIITMPTDEITYYGSKFSDLEFDDYLDIGLIMGLDYICPIAKWFYLTAGAEVQLNLYTNSKIVANTKFINSAVSYSIGIGFKINTAKKESAEIKQ